jgi:hypothetical protein
MKQILLIILFFAPTFIWAQKTDSLRAFYIHEYPDHFFVWPVIKYRSLSFEFRNSDSNKEKIEFKPNNSFAMGAGFYLFDLGFELVFAVPLEEKSIDRFGKTSVQDVQLNILSKKWGADAYYQKYSGYYRDDSRESIPSSQPYPQRPDVDTKNFGVSGIYVFNNRKFSLRSSYTFAERQIKSKGSFMLYGTINSFKLTADSAILSLESRAGLVEGADFTQLRYTTLSFAPGYSYNLVYRKFFFNATLSIGPAHHWVYYKKESGKERNDVVINSTGSVRLALGYNSDRFFGGIGFVTQSRNVIFEDVRFSNASNTVKLLIGYRFKEFGILKKSVWDFVPFL